VAARGENPKKALPLCVASALWWISAESDGAGAQCGALLAMRHLQEVRAPDSLKAGSGNPDCQAVLRDLLRSSRTVSAYARDLHRLHGKACDLLDELDSTLTLPMPGSRELIGV
jgi:hypothetical protein